MAANTTRRAAIERRLHFLTLVMRTLPRKNF
jgi:hypothetical protein